MFDTRILMLILCAVIAYLIGSISFSYLFSKEIKHEDTTNMLRNYGWKLGILTLLCDLLKAVGSALIGYFIGGDYGMYIASVFVIVGHVWSCYLKFKGGKGIAATTGVLLVMNPLPTIIIFAVCVLIVVKTKIMSIGSIIGLIASAAVTFIMFPENHYMQIAVVIIAKAPIAIAEIMYSFLVITAEPVSMQIMGTTRFGATRARDLSIFAIPAQVFFSSLEGLRTASIPWLGMSAKLITTFQRTVVIVI